MKVSIIIRCLNEAKFIGKLLSGIEAQDYKDIEIIIVDSGSKDETLVIASQFETKIVQIKPELFSFGYSLNKGCELATGEILLFASAHVYPLYENWISELIQPFKEKEIALVYGKQIGDLEVTKYSEQQLFLKWFPENSDLNQQHPFCNNANCAIRKELWKDQQYNEKLTGLEDLDWAVRIMNKGYRIAYSSDAEIVHIHEENPKRILNRYRREAIALKQILPKEKFSIRQFIILSIANIFSDYIHAFRDGVFFKNVFDIPLFRLTQFWGTFKGYRQVGNISNKLRSRFYYPNHLKPFKEEVNPMKKKIRYGDVLQNNLVVK